MTDKIPPLSTPTVPPSQPVHAPAAVATAHDVSVPQDTVEEEPYTIKCICGYSDDDGNTILCEICNSWQHIDCYYPNKDAKDLSDFEHECVDCKPRPLDSKQAIERQLARTAAIPAREEPTNDKKVKRPPSKSHKKKPKPTDLQLNGHPTGADTSKNLSPHDQPPAKKAKNSHKASQSGSVPPAKRSPSYGSARVGQGHPPSPLTTPPDLPDDADLYTCSKGFLSLCNDQSATISHINTYVSLTVSNIMSEWLRDPDKMQRETAWRSGDVFRRLPPNIHALKKPVDVQQIKKTVGADMTIQWHCLRAPAFIDKDVPLLEVNGQIGFQASYCADPQNRWAGFTTPLPFVLFHPMLPLYIDARREGSEARFVRRSCRPNAVLETYLSEGREYQFWLVSDRPIPAQEEITILWDFRFPNAQKLRMLQILGLNDEESGAADPEVEEAEYREIASWLHVVLSEYGGCACNLGSDCAFVKFHRSFALRTNQPSQPKKKRKSKTQANMSPTSTGRATNSRAPSEGHMEEVPDHDRRSVSGSSRSKTPSRDLTPVARQGSFDMLGILTEPTDRDKRKVAMVEDSFRRMEQQQPPRKKKRTSDSTASVCSGRTKVARSQSSTQTLSNGTGERHQYVDAGTVRSKSGSPASGVSPRGTTRDSGARGDSPSGTRAHSVPSGVANYCNASTQTGEAPPPRRRVMSLNRRLLNGRYSRRHDLEQGIRSLSLNRVESSSVMDVDSPPASRPAPSPSLDKDADKAFASASPTSLVPVEGSMPDAAMSSPMGPVSGAHVLVPTKQSPDLRVLLPPVPAFGGPSSALSTVAMPRPAGGSVGQPPLIGVQTSFGPSVNGSSVSQSPVTPSPLKKLSLSDYTKSRMNKVPRPSTTGLKTATGADEPRSATSVERDSPATDRPGEGTF